jgi:hypothetical protein
VSIFYFYIYNTILIIFYTPVDVWPYDDISFKDEPVAIATPLTNGGLDIIAILNQSYYTRSLDREQMKFRHSAVSIIDNKTLSIITSQSVKEATIIMSKGEHGSSLLIPESVLGELKRLISLYATPHRE